jgi:hypothetical protein
MQTNTWASKVSLLALICCNWIRTYVHAVHCDRQRNYKMLKWCLLAFLQKNAAMIDELQFAFSTFNTTHLTNNLLWASKHKNLNSLLIHYSDCKYTLLTSSAKGLHISTLTSPLEIKDSPHFLMVLDWEERCALLLSFNKQCHAPNFLLFSFRSKLYNYMNCSIPVQ